MGKHLDCLIAHGLDRKEYEDLYDAAEQADLNFDTIGSFDEVEALMIDKKRVAQIQAVIEEDAVAKYHGSVSDSEVEPILGVMAKDVDDSARQFSAESMSEGVMRQYYRQIPETLETFQPDWLGRSTRKLDQEDLVRALSGKEVGSAYAKKAAKELKQVFEDMRLRANRAGYSIKQLSDWMLPQGHNPGKIAKAGQEAWANDLIEGGMLDIGRMGYTQASKGELKDYLINTVYRKIIDETANSGSGFSTKSVHRFMHFKDPEAWIKYQKQYGAEDIIGTVYSHINKTSNDIAIAEKFGPNPIKTFDRIKAAHIERFDNSNKARGAAEAAQSIFDEMIHGRQIANRGMHKMASSVKHSMNVMMLKSTPILTATDLGYGVGEAMFLGMPPYRSIIGMMKAWNPLNKAHKRLALRVTGNIDYYMNSNVTAMRYGDIEGGHKFIRELSAFAAKFSGLEHMTNAHRTGFGIELSSFLADGLKYGFDNPQTARAFKSQGIDEATLKHWKTGIFKHDNGVSYVDVGKIDDLDAASKYTAFMKDGEAYAVPSGGARPRTFLGGGGTGTASSEFWSLAVQYKTFPVTIYNGFVRRSFASKAMTGTGRLAYASSVIASVTGLGILAYQAGNFVKKGEIEEWGAETVMKGFMKGGPLGLYGDIFGMLAGEPGTMAGVVAGPSASTANKIMGIGKDVVKGDVKKGAIKAGKLASRMIPGNVLTEAIINKMLKKGLNETSDNGIYQ